MPFIPHTEAEVRDMLAAIGAADLSALFDEIPSELICKGLSKVPEGLSEMDIGRVMRGYAALDGQPLSFIGAGAYEHHIPAAVWEITTRGEFIRRTRLTRPRPARARCSCSTNTRA
jgi:glycine dehydrogenase subunit 1